MNPKTVLYNQKYSMSFPKTILPLGRVEQYRNDLQKSLSLSQKIIPKLAVHQL